MWIHIDSESNLTLTRQLYNQLKEMILTGALAKREKLPSTRALAEELHISRNTVLEVYNQLIAEGYLEGHHGSGTVVTSYLSEQLTTLGRTNKPAIPKPKESVENFINFHSGIPDLSFFPRKEWARLYHNICNDLPVSALQYNSPAGVYELRCAISRYLYKIRGIRCNPNQIMVVSGSTQGLSLVSKLLYRDNQQVIIENPVHSGLLEVIASIGYQITGIPVDLEGLQTKLLLPSDRTSFIYTTPSHQYPMGGILPLPRRIALIQYALENDCYIIEDDYDSEFRFEGQPINSLYELKPEKVIYIGSFSKILAPAIRLGFILLPEELIDKYIKLKQYSDVHTETISQYVLADFMNNGGLEKHIWKMKKLYNKKREHLLQELSNHFQKDYDLYGHATGLHVVVHFHKVIFTDTLLEKIKSSHIKIYPVAQYSISQRADYQHDIILGYAHLTYEEITEGIRVLKDVLY